MRCPIERALGDGISGLDDGSRSRAAGGSGLSVLYLAKTGKVEPDQETEIEGESLAGSVFGPAAEGEGEMTCSPRWNIRIG